MVYLIATRIWQSNKPFIRKRKYGQENMNVKEIYD